MTNDILTFNHIKIKHAQFSARKSRFYAQNAQKFGGAAKIA